jgi:hypothetical protein
MISLEGYSELVARKKSANDRRVSKSPEPWIPFNREVDVRLDATRGIDYAIKMPKDYKNDVGKCSIPAELLIWVNPSDLRTAYATSKCPTKVFE